MQKVTISEISQFLYTDKSIICRDLSYIKSQARATIQSYVQERLPTEINASLCGLSSVLKEAWNVVRTTQDNREKINALSLCKETYSVRTDLLTNMNLVEDALRLISHKKNNLLQVNEKQEEDHQEQQQQGQDQDLEIESESEVESESESKSQEPF